MEDRENSDPQRSDQEDLVKDEDNCWSQENVDRAVRTFVSICLGEERPYEYNINQQRARDADSREQTVQTATLNPLETQSHVQASAGDSREKHTQGLCGDDSRTAENDFTKDNSRGAASRTVCDLGQRGHYVKAPPKLGGIGGVYTSPCSSATPMPSVRPVGSFPSLGLPSETSFPKEPSHEAIGTQSSDQQKEHLTEFVSNDYDRYWSQDKMKELDIYLNEDPFAASSSTNQGHETRSRSSEIVTNMATWGTSTPRIAAATMHQEAEDAHWPTLESNPHITDSVQATSMLQGQYSTHNQIPKLDGIGEVYTSPYITAPAMPFVRPVGRFPLSFPKRPAQGAIGTQIGDQQQERWTDVVSDYSNDADMRWSQKQTRQLHNHLHGDAQLTSTAIASSVWSYGKF
eukprot:scpid79366/ scgid0487/ 